MTPFVRTVLGDVDPAELGPTYAHEHLVIAGGRPVELFPDFRLDDVDRMVEELSVARAVGLGAVVDAMPCDAGRDAMRLAEVGKRSGVHVIAPTGLHHARFYDDRHWSLAAAPEDLADLFVADILDGIDAFDYGGPIVRRTPHRAGVIKVAGSRDGLTDRDRRAFEAAALAHARTGCPILTHCEDGTGALEQLRLLAEFGVEPARVALSHVDKVVDRGYHREILSTSAFVEYDQAFRWPDDGDNGTLRLVEWIIEDGREDQVVLGMDAARRGYLAAYGGSPGLGFLLGPFSDMMAKRGIGKAARDRFFVANPARWLTISEGSA